MINAAVIGISGFGKVHAQDLLRLHRAGKLNFSAAAVRNPGKAPELVEALRAAGVTIHADHSALLQAMRGQLGLVFVPTPIHLHEAMTREALAAGAHVFVEKPAAATLGSVHRMMAAEQQAQRVVAVGYQAMYSPETRAMKEAILSGSLGAIRAIKCVGCWPRPDAYYQNGWVGSLRQGATWIMDSPFNNAFAHQLNLMCFLAGRRFDASADLATVEAELYRARDIETADTAAIRLLTSNGVPIYFFASHVSERVANPRVIVRGDVGEIAWTMEGVTIRRAGQAEESFVSAAGPALRDQMYESVLRRLDDPHAFICTLGIAAVQTLAANGAQMSGEVRTVPAELIGRIERDGAGFSVIRGIDEIFERCFEQERLPSEIGVKWASPDRRIELSPAAVEAAFP